MSARGSSAPVLALLVLLAGAYLLAIYRERPPDAVPASAPATEFSAVRAFAALSRVLEHDGAHPSGSPAHARVRERIVHELETLGLAPEEQVAFVCGPYSLCSTARNILVRIDPEGGATLKAVLVSAHYDSVAAGPGAADDGAGVACLLEIASAIVAGPPPRRPVILLFTDDEETGLNGALAFCEEHPWAEEVGAAVNLEARGTTGVARAFEVSGPTRFWADVLAVGPPRPCAASVSEEVYRRMPNDTDLTVFADYGIPALNFAFIGGVSRYHTPRDDLAHLDTGSLQHLGESALAVLRALVRHPNLDEIPGREAVWADLYNFELLVAPGMPVRIVTAVLAGLAVWIFYRRRVAGLATIRGALGAAIAALLIVAFGAVVVLGLAKLVDVLAEGGVARSFASRAAPRVTLLTGVLAAHLFLGLRFAARMSFWSAWSGVWLLVALLAVAATLVAPGATYLFTIPLLASVCTALSGREHDRGRRVAACLLPVFFAAPFWVPIGYALEITFGRALDPIGAVAFGALLVPLLPVYTVVPLRPLLRLTAAATIVALVGAVTSAMLAGDTSDEPRKLDVVYHLDVVPTEEGDEARTRWLALGQPGAVPDAMTALFHFEGRDRALPWTRSKAVAAGPAPAFPLAPPMLVVERSEALEDGRRLACRIRSVRGAHSASLAIPRSAGAVELLAGDRYVPSNSPRVRAVFPDYEVFTFDDLDEAGLELELTLSTHEPVEAILVDRTPGIPDPKLLESRPPNVVPFGHGDQTIVSVRVQL